MLSNTFVAAGQSGQKIEKEATLNPTGILPQANGKARAEVEPQREKLRVEADHLESGASYAIIADGVNLGSTTAQSGYLRVDFSSDGSSGTVLPPSVRPITNIQTIELRNANGQAVVRGTFQSGGDDFGGGGGHGGGETSFTGVIESLPGAGFIGDWRVGGRTVHVTASTEIRQNDGAAVVGAQVEVRGTTQADGSINATRVEVLSSGGGGGQADREAVLNPTGIDPDATGRVKTDFSSSREELEIEASKLEETSNYTVTVDGFQIPVSTDNSGSFKIRFSTEDGSLPSQVRPVSNIQQIRISDSQGRLVLVGGPPV
jgi:hypothetical protein